MVEIFDVSIPDAFDKLVEYDIEESEYISEYYRPLDWDDVLDPEDPDLVTMKEEY